MVIKSQLPELLLPKVDVFSFFFDRKDRQYSADKGVKMTANKLLVSTTDWTSTVPRHNLTHSTILLCGVEKECYGFWKKVDM